MSGRKPSPIYPDPVKPLRFPGPAVRERLVSVPRSAAQSHGIDGHLRWSDLYSPDVSKCTDSPNISGSVAAGPVFVTLGGSVTRLPVRGIMAGSLPVALREGRRAGDRSA